MRKLNLDLEKSTFVKNEDDTYTVYQRIGNSGVLKLPKVSIEIKAEAMIDDSVGDFWQWIDCKNTSTIKLFIRKVLTFLKHGGKNEKM